MALVIALVSKAILFEVEILVTAQRAMSLLNEVGCFQGLLVDDALPALFLALLTLRHEADAEALTLINVFGLNL